MLGQRGSIFGQAVLNAAQEDEKFVLLTADLATLSGMTKYINKYPNQFYNVGIAEQEDDSEPFREKMERLTFELRNLFEENQNVILPHKDRIVTLCLCPQSDCTHLTFYF